VKKSQIQLQIFPREKGFPLSTTFGIKQFQAETYLMILHTLSVATDKRIFTTNLDSSHKTEMHLVPTTTHWERRKAHNLLKTYLQNHDLS